MADDAMDEWDNIIRQKVSGLDTPPPGTGWQPGRSWEKVQGQLAEENLLAENPGKPVRAGRWAWYHAAAAAFVILLVPFAVMLSDIRKQQGQIERLAAQLARTKPATPPPGPAAPEASAPLARATPPETAARREAEPPAAPGTKGDRITRQPATPPEPEPAAEPVADRPVADRLAGQPAPAVPQTPVEAAPPGPPAPAEDSQAQLLRLVSTAPKREATSVTIVFAGAEPDTTAGEVLAANPDPAPGPPRRRFLRTFGGSKREETLAAPIQAPNNILSLLTKKY